ncbi:MAG TPA: hypothetical protein VEQ59_22140 [Polyangiaceae bacterium]|nr:hypothetical protein [Polyangiaceae bacterium]
MKERLFAIFLLTLVGGCGDKSTDDVAPLKANGGRGGAQGGESGSSSRPAPSSQGGASDAPEAHVFSIQFDYRFDRAGFFDEHDHAERRAALEAAAAVWSGLIDEDFLEVPADTRLRLNDPENRDEGLWVEGLDRDIDDVLVFVGTTEAIPGYGRGGPATVAESPDSTLNQSFVNRVTSSPFEPWAGSISFKGSVDYFFDPSPESDDDLPRDAYDFISLATHELGHVLGFTPSPAFSALEEGDAFVGKIAAREYGAPVPLTEDHLHLADGTISHEQEALMTPKLPNGVRRRPTPLDTATLQDLGYALKE